MSRRSLRLFLVLTCAALPLASAQTQTVPNPNGLGGSIVEVVTTDINALPVTQIINSIAPGAVTTAVTPAVPGAATTTAAATTNPAIPTTATPVVPTTATPAVPTTQPAQGPVQQPPATVPVGQGVTSYEYTTVDALGETTILHDIFTPTYNTPSPPSSPAVGTVLSPSDWSAIIGTHTAGGPTNAGESWRITRTGAGGIFLLAVGAAAGGWAVL